MPPFGPREAPPLHSGRGPHKEEEEDGERERWHLCGWETAYRSREVIIDVAK